MMYVINFIIFKLYFLL